MGCGVAIEHQGYPSARLLAAQLSHSHSWTIIGLVRCSDESVNLIMLDPANHFTSKDVEKSTWQIRDDALHLRPAQLQ
jgi:hypothetical protein